MLNQHRDPHQRLSLYHCKAKYGHYGCFATCPLLTAVLNSDIYDLEAFKKRVREELRISDSGLADYVNGLTYEDKNYLTVDETQWQN